MPVLFDGNRNPFTAPNRRNPPMTSSEPEDRFDMENNLSYHIVGLASNLNRSAIRAFKRGARLSVPEWRLIAILGNERDMRFHQLVELLDVDKGWVSRTLMKLERRGFAERFPDPVDGRQFRVRITPMGHEVRRRGNLVSRERQRQLEASFSASELQQLYSLLGRLRVAIDTLADAPATAQSSERPSNARPTHAPAHPADDGVAPPTPSSGSTTGPQRKT